MQPGHWAGHLVLFASTLLALAVFLGFKAWHRWRRRRDPLAGRKSVGHLPGQQLIERIRHHEDEVGRAVFMSMLAMPLMYMVWASFHIEWMQVTWGVREWMFSAGALILFAWGVIDYVRHYRKREQASDGWLAEQVTGQQLNRLVAHGCLVLHDLPAEFGNIDHVVIAPRGVFAVETKSFRKPRGVDGGVENPGHHVHFDGRGLRFPEFATTEPISQALRQAQWLRRVLHEAIGRDVPVFPAVSLPGWYVLRSDEGKRSEVQAFTPMGRGADFMGWPQPERIDAATRQLIASHLAARYPVIDA